MTQADALGNVTAFEYDGLDRRTRVAYPDTGAGSAEATFAYDENGRWRPSPTPHALPTCWHSPNGAWPT
ncbi:MAG: RHS repeat domain-containing protein [Gammaproteobacteria bacterium]|nr:RHS repeat domain-containing protein [Gammaproteobacteria bacterium]